MFTCFTRPQLASCAPRCAPHGHWPCCKTRQNCNSQTAAVHSTQYRFLDRPRGEGGGKGQPPPWEIYSGMGPNQAPVLRGSNYGRITAGRRGTISSCAFLVLFTCYCPQRSGPASATLVLVVFFCVWVHTCTVCTSVVTPTVHPGEPLPRLPPNQYKNQGRPQDFELRSPGGNLSFLDISMWKFPCLGGSPPRSR